MISALRVLIADDHRGMAALLSELIEESTDMTLVGLARSAPEAIELARVHTPDVALLDVMMPGGGGPAAAVGILGASPGTRVAAFSSSTDQSTIDLMMAAGATSYITKGVTNDELLDAIRHCASKTPGS